MIIHTIIMEEHPHTSSSSSHNTLFSSSSSNSNPHLHHHNHHHHLSNTIHHSLLTTLKAHNTSYISSLALSHNFLYTGSSDREIRSWNRTPFITPSATNVVHAGNGAVKSLIVHSNKLFSAHQDHKIRVWKITTINNNTNNNEDEDQEHSQNQKYTHLATLPTLGDRASKMLIPKNHVQIRRHKKCTWVHHVDTVSSLALSRDGALLYSVSWDRTLKIWRTKDFTCLESLTKAHDDAINAVAVSCDGVVYTGSADKRIKVWRKTEGSKKHVLVDTLEKHGSGVNALALSSDEGVLYSGACDRRVMVWEKEEGEGGKIVAVGVLKGHTESILCLGIVAGLVCSGSADKTIRVWRRVCRGEYECLAVLEGHRGSVKCLSAVVDRSSQSHESFLIYSGGLDCDIKVWQILVPAV